MKILNYQISAWMIITLFAFPTLATAEQNGKWLDYGSGLINLNRVSRIASFTNSDLCRGEKVSKIDLDDIRNSDNFVCVYAIKFDDFILPLIKTDLQKTFSHPELIKYNVERQSKVMGNIRKFLDNSDSYMMLKRE